MQTITDYVMFRSHVNCPPRSRPVSLGVLQVALGNYVSCARLTGGGLECWGPNLLDLAHQHTSIADSILNQPIGVAGIGAGAYDLRDPERLRRGG
jgi:hypothetical protein